LLKKLFKKEAKVSEIRLVSPVEGETLPLEDVPDPVFSQKMIGDGIAFLPREGKVVAPADAIVTHIFTTKHAVALETAEGLELLIHIGLDTVNMQGEGFSIHVAEGSQVKQGDLLVTFDLKLIKKKATSSITLIIITSGEIVQQLEHHYSSHSLAGETPVLIATIK